MPFFLAPPMKLLVGKGAAAKAGHVAKGAHRKAVVKRRRKKDGTEIEVEVESGEDDDGDQET